MAPRRADGQPGTALGVVLAGGRGSRLGGAKATVELAGRALIDFPLGALAAAGLEAVVVAKRDSPLPALDCPLVIEPDEPRHPLCGIVTALRHADGRALVALGCDMPLVPPALLAALAARPEPLVALTRKGRAQPFPARYGPELLRPLEQALAREDSLQGALAALAPALLHPAELAAFGEPSSICLNVNTRADLARTERLLTGPR